jgi:hypothetical protein
MFWFGFLVFVFVPSTRRLIFGSRTDVFLWAKAEVVAETRQVLRLVGNLLQRLAW